MERDQEGRQDSAGENENWARVLDVEINRRDFMIASAAMGALASLPAFAKNVKAAQMEPPAPTLDLTLKVNGQERNLKIDTRETLLDVARERLGLTGAKKGCDHGQCGACTMIVDGKRINSCLSLAALNQGKEIITIEGLAKGDKLHPMQQAFIDHEGYQCGFCTPGQIMSAVALMKERCGNSEEEIRECMSGNICRCGAYRGILEAIQEVKKNGGKNASV